LNVRKFFNSALLIYHIKMKALMDRLFQV